MSDSLKSQIESKQQERHDEVMHQLKQTNITLVALTSAVMDIAGRIGALQEEQQGDGPDMRTL